MNKPETVGAERVDEATGEIVEAKADMLPVSAELFPRNPAEAVQEMRKLIGMMKEMIDDAGRDKYIQKINDKDYPMVTWWTTIALPLQLMAVLRWTKRIDAEPNSGFDNETWQSRVEVVHLPTGNIVSAGEGLCSATEGGMFVKTSACAAMSHTRAIGRAFRGPLAGLAVFAGINATPAEEMTEAERGVEAVMVEADKVFVGEESKDEYAALAATTFSFGKHKGKTFAQVRADAKSKGYFRWYEENAKPEKGSAFYDKNLPFYEKIVRFRKLAKAKEAE